MPKKWGYWRFPPPRWAPLHDTPRIPKHQVLLVTQVNMLDWPWNQISTYKSCLKIISPLTYQNGTIALHSHTACCFATGSLAWSLSLSYLADWVPKDSAKREACELPMSPVKTIALVFQLLWCAVNLMLSSLFLSFFVFLSYTITGSVCTTSHIWIKRLIIEKLW